MKTYKVRKRISAQARRELQRIVDTHEFFRRSYFWSPGCNARMRGERKRRFERLNPDVAFETRDGLLVVKLGYSESCRYCRYSAGIYLNGNIANIRAVKKLLG